MPGRVLLAGNIEGRIAELSLDGPTPSALLPPIARDDAWIAFPSTDKARCRLGERILEARDSRFSLPRGPSATRIAGA